MAPVTGEDLRPLTPGGEDSLFALAVRLVGRPAVRVIHHPYKGQITTRNVAPCGWRNRGVSHRPVRVDDVRLRQMLYGSCFTKLAVAMNVRSSTSGARLAMTTPRSLLHETWRHRRGAAREGEPRGRDRGVACMEDVPEPSEAPIDE
jgi:hypothetical protein